jgi:hypothetical protein
MKQRRVALEGVEVPVFWRGGFEAEVQGPCLIEEAHSVTYVPAGATVRQEATHLVIELA